MARKNPHDDDYFFEQYQQSPYGARAAVPAARRNGSELVGPVLFTSKGQPYRRTANGKARFISKANAAKANGYSRAVTNGRMSITGSGSDYPNIPVQQEFRLNPRRGKAKRKGNPLAGAAARRAQEIFRSKGCSMGDAMKQAWAEVKRGGAQAAANPWFFPEYSPLYLPDETQTRNALVRGPYGDLAFTNSDEDRPGMSPDMWGDSNFWGGRQLQRGGFAAREGQFSASGTSGFQPVNRRNPKARKNKKR